MGFAHISTGRSYRLFGVFLAVLALSVFIIGTILYFLPISLAASESSYFSQTRVWAHRGGNTGEFAQNSPEAVADAFAKGFDGVELDTYFDRSLDKIVVSHERPYVRRGEGIVTLDVMLLPPNGRLWLDLKNLGELTGGDIRRFAEILSELGFANRAFVESTALRQLVHLDAQGIQTIYWMSADGTRTSIYYVAVKAITWLFGIDAVSISVANLQHIQPHFVPSSIFSFTENSAKRLCELSHQSAVAVILTDLPADELASMTCNWHSSWI